MSKLLEGRKLLFYDFEVFADSIHPDTGKSYWMVCFVEYETKKKFTIKNDIEKLEWFYEAYKDSIFIGYNSRAYDQWVFKGLLLGMDAGYITKQIIEKDIKGHNVVKGAYKFPLLNYDCSTGFHGLKQLEAFMGSKIKESDVPFNIDRPLTEDEEMEVEEYCTHDVMETIKVFDKTYNKFNSQISVMEMFDVEIKEISRTSAQLTAMILEAEKLEGLNDEYDFIYPDTLKLDKYQFVKDWFDSIKDGSFRGDEKGKIEVEFDIAGNPTVYALGGVHGALKNFTYEGRIYSLDVASLYPALVLEYGLMSRAVPSDEKFRYIRDERIKLKKAKNPLQEALKLIINSVYGTFGDQYNPLYDKRMMRSVCVSGQLLLTDFIEKIEPYCKLFNINTDGVFFAIDDDENHDYNFNKIMEAKEEWENRTRLILELEEYKRVVQKDVNNYVVVPDGEPYYPNGKPRWKAKGAYVKALSDIDYDLPIVNFAINNYFVLGKPIEDTINECNDLRDFQKVIKLTSAYNYALKNCTFSKEKVINETTGRLNTKTVWDGNGEILTDKTFRVFASTRECDGGIFKQKIGKNPEKFANTPDNCFIDNEEVLGKSCPDYLDKQFYIDLAQTRINQYLGIKNKPKKK